MVGDTGLEPVTSAMHGQRFCRISGGIADIISLQQGDEVLQVAMIRLLHALSIRLTEMIVHSSPIVGHNCPECQLEFDLLSSAWSPLRVT